MGFAELLLILIVVFLFFGAGKLPAIGDGLGKAIKGLKDSLRSDAPPRPAERAEPAEKKQLPPGP